MTAGRLAGRRGTGGDARMMTGHDRGVRMTAGQAQRGRRITDAASGPYWSDHVGEAHQGRISCMAPRCREVAAIEVAAIEEGGGTGGATSAAIDASGEVVVQIAPGGVQRLDQREFSPA